MNKNYEKVSKVLFKIGIVSFIILLIVMLIGKFSLEDNFIFIWGIVSFVLVISHAPVNWDKAMEEKECVNQGRGE